MNIGEKWTGEESEKLTILWKLGHSSSEISRQFDGKYSRSAVMGRIHRLGLKALPKGNHQVVLTKKTNLPPKPYKAAVAVTEKPTPAILPETHADRGQCHHITGDPCAPGWQMCGRPVKPGRDYCVYHHSLMFVPSHTKAS